MRRKWESKLMTGAVALSTGVSVWMALAVSTMALGQAPATAPAGNPADPLSKEAQTAYERVKPNILKAADKMPDADYPFRATPDIRTFGRVVNHVTEAQLHVCGALNGTKPADLPTVPPETADKAAIVTALKASFAECDKAYAAQTDATIAEMVQSGPAKRSRLGMLWGNVSHDNEQYSALATYLRLKGLVPPSSEK